MSNIKEFNPQDLSLYETKAWKAYYEKNFLKLLYLTFLVCKKFFRKNFFLTFKISYYSAISAALFSLKRGNENKDNLKEYAKFRAEAMVLHDIDQDSKVKTDWTKVEELLLKSYNALKIAVTK